MSNPKFEDIGWWELGFALAFLNEPELLFDYCQGAEEGGMQIWETDSAFEEIAYIKRDGINCHKPNESLLDSMKDFDKKGFRIGFEFWYDENKPSFSK